MTRSLSAERAEKRQAALERLRSRRGSRIRAPKEWKSTTDFFAHRLEPFLRQREGGDSASAEEVKTVFEEARKKSKAKRTDQRAETSEPARPRLMESSRVAEPPGAGGNEQFSRKPFQMAGRGFARVRRQFTSLRNRTPPREISFRGGLWRPCFQIHPEELVELESQIHARSPSDGRA
jgi:hypothetical protein